MAQKGEVYSFALPQTNKEVPAVEVPVGPMTKDQLYVIVAEAYIKIWISYVGNIK